LNPPTRGPVRIVGAFVQVTGAVLIRNKEHLGQQRTLYQRWEEDTVFVLQDIADMPIDVAASFATPEHAPCSDALKIRLASRTARISYIP
jgi:hypothetical protein